MASKFLKELPKSIGKINVTNVVNNTIKDIDTKIIGTNIEKASTEVEKVLEEIDNSKVGKVANMVPQYKTIKTGVNITKTIGKEIQNIK